MKPYLKTKDFSVTGEEFQLLYKKELDMLVTSPQPEDLGKYYYSDTYISHTDSRRSTTDKLYQLVKKYGLWKKVRLTNRYAFSNKTLLDVGAGTGDFLVAARRKGWSVYGVEPNRMARDKASEKGLQLSHELHNQLNRKYQVITLWHTLEHLPYLEEQIDKLISCLEKEGTLIIAVPNYMSYDARHYDQFWAAYDVPRHLWHFSRSSIEKLFSKYGMRIVKTRPMIFDAFYVSLLSEKYKTGKSNFVRALLMGLRSNIDAWRTKEYSSLLYILQRT